MARITSAHPSATSVLSDEDLMGSILRLEGRDLVRAQLVCKQWQRLLVGDHRFPALVEMGKNVARLSNYGDDYPCFEDEDFLYTGGWSGYGSS